MFGKKIPRHVALILDGNRRWARSKGLDAIGGHRKAADTVDSLLTRLDERGVQTVTLWGFSTENWKRDKLQVAGLMSLIEEFLIKYRERAIKDEVRVVHLGRKDRMPQSLLRVLDDIEEATHTFSRRVLNIALDYGGRDEIIRAIHRAASQGEDVSAMTEESFEAYLDTAQQDNPEPDIIVRTGGEMRMSGFMIWQSIYSEYYFTQTFLPDMTPDDIDAIIAEYQHRERRFGAGK